MLPLERLAALDVDGSLALKQLTLTGQSIQPFKAEVVARDGRIQLKQLDGGIFSGTFAWPIASRSVASMVVKTPPSDS